MLPDFFLRLKVHCMSRGIRLTDQAVSVLSKGGTEPLTVHEYATTGGVTLRMGDVYLNAPFDDWYCDRSEAWLDVDEVGGFVVTYTGESVACEMVPLPGYLTGTNSLGHPVART